MKLNLGCGFRKLPGWVNVDVSTACAPDQVADIERIPWPWPSDYANHVLLSHVLEHLGESRGRYLAIMKELWRVCAPDARVSIIVPHPRHDSFLGDPTHVRPITADGLALFDRARNARWIAAGAGNTPLGLVLGIDFALEETRHRLDRRWRARLDSGALTREEITEAIRTHANVVQETRMELRAVKPLRPVPNAREVTTSPPGHGA